MLISGFPSAKQMNGEPPQGQDTSLSLVTIPSKLHTHSLLGGQREFSGHKDFCPCRDSNPGPSELQDSVLPLDYRPPSSMPYLAINRYKRVQDFCKIRQPIGISLEKLSTWVSNGRYQRAEEKQEKEGKRVRTGRQKLDIRMGQGKREFFVSPEPQNRREDFRRPLLPLAVCKSQINVHLTARVDAQQALFNVPWSYTTAFDKQQGFPRGGFKSNYTLKGKHICSLNNKTSAKTYSLKSYTFVF